MRAYYRVRRAVRWIFTDAGLLASWLSVALATVIAALTSSQAPIHHWAEIVVRLGTMIGLIATSRREPKAEITKPNRIPRGPHG